MNYVIHAIHKHETRYTEVENLALALVTMVRRVSPYFLTNPLTVLKNSSVDHIMAQPDISRRLLKWTVKLEEYDIEYQLRIAIKARALTYFIDEMVPESIEEARRIYVDGAVNKYGSGVKMILISPSGEKVKDVVKVYFKASNIEAEYEVVLVGLREAKEDEATRVVIYFDS